MKNFHVEFTDERFESPMTRWVHVFGTSNETMPPPLPSLTALGYPRLVVEIDGFVFEFASLYEVRHLVEAFEAKVLPATRYPDNNPRCGRRESGYANRHWISRLPSKTKRAKYRQQAAKYLRAILPEVQKWFVDSARP